MRITWRCTGLYSAVLFCHHPSFD